MDPINASKTLKVTCFGILFDMDGTLVDSTAIVERQWSRFAERHALDYAQIMRVSHGRRNAETIREIAPHLATPEIFARFDAEELVDLSGVVAVRGARELLAALRTGQWAVVTSASKELATIRLQSAGLPVPQVVVGADDVSKGKPNPEGYLLAASQLGLSSAECLVFEDTLPGLNAGKAAGMRCIGIATTYSPSELGGVDCIANFEGALVTQAERALTLSLTPY